MSTPLRRCSSVVITLLLWSATVAIGKSHFCLRLMYLHLSANRVPYCICICYLCAFMYGPCCLLIFHGMCPLANTAHARHSIFTTVPVSEGTIPARPLSPLNCTSAFNLFASPAITPSTFTCLWKQGYRHVTVFTPHLANCSFDASAITTVAAARAAGFAVVDVAVSPAATTCEQDPISDMDILLDLFSSPDSHFSSLWLDVSSTDMPSNGWVSGGEGACVSNRQWLGPALRHTGHRLGFDRVGIVSKRSEWETLLCDTNDFRHIKLWYESVGAANVDDWPQQHFGGWQQPQAKQYSNPIQQCGATIQQDFRVDGQC